MASDPKSMTFSFGKPLTEEEFKAMQANNPKAMVVRNVTLPPVEKEKVKARPTPKK